MAGLNLRIPDPDVPVVDPITGKMTVDWYDALKKLQAGPAKIVVFTRSLGAAAGNQSIAGVGFTPRLIQWQTAISGGGGWASYGESDGIIDQCVELQMASSAFMQGNVAGVQRDSSGNYQSFVLSSFDVDGFTIAWTKVGAPTATATVVALCYR